MSITPLIEAGLVQTGDVKVLETAVQYAEKLKSIETSMGQFGNTTTSITNLENSFTKLGLSTDEVNSKMEAVKTELISIKTVSIRLNRLQVGLLRLVQMSLLLTHRLLQKI